MRVAGSVRRQGPLGDRLDHKIRGHDMQARSLETMVLELADLKEQRRESVKDYNERIKDLERDIKKMALQQTNPAPQKECAAA